MWDIFTRAAMEKALFDEREGLQARLAQTRWEWFGHPGHFILCYRCCWHLHTHVGGYCVSSVGGLHPRGDEVWDLRHEPLGADRDHLFETLVFPPSFWRPHTFHEEFEPVDIAKYRTRQEAEKGHMEMCKKWSASHQKEES